MPRAKAQAATLWIYTERGRATGDDIETAWSQKKMGEKHDLSFNPVEFYLRLSDVPAAVAKWEKIAGMPNVCKVVIRDKPGYERYHELYL